MLMKLYSIAFSLSKIRLLMSTLVICRTWTCIMQKLILQLWLERPIWMKSLVRWALINQSESLAVAHFCFLCLII